MPDTWESASLHALRCLPHVGNAALERILAHFKSAEAAWEAENGAFTGLGLSEGALESLRRRTEIVNREAAWADLAASDIRIIPKGAPEYPALLGEIPDAPPLLYTRGSYDFSKTAPLIAVVGSRKFSSYGREATERLAYDLAARGAVIVSGFAFGIDKLAHEVALTAGGETISVLPGGIDDRGIVPRTHAGLAESIIGRGALISEFPPGTVVTPGHFPLRNRLIAGLALGVLIIEAAEGSGSLITARLALEYDREVFAVPGSIFSPVSVGPNRLIREGAKTVLSAEDVMAEFGRFFEKKEAAEASEGGREVFLTEKETLVYEALGHEPLHVDRIIQMVRLGTAETHSLLTLLEIKGVAKNIGNMHYIRK